MECLGGEKRTALALILYWEFHLGDGPGWGDLMVADRPRLYHLNRSSRPGRSIGAGMVYAVWAADGWFTFDCRPSC